MRLKVTLQDEETPIDREIVNAIVALAPATWDRAVLEVEYSVDDHVEGFDHVLYNPDGERDLVEPTDMIYDATLRLQELFRKYGGCWSRVRYEVTIEEDGVQYKVRFEIVEVGQQLSHPEDEGHRNGPVGGKPDQETN
jgi:hypothetical protein